MSLDINVSLYLKTLKAIKAGHGEKALELLQTMGAEEPNAPAYLRGLLGRAFNVMGNYAAALPHLQYVTKGPLADEADYEALQETMSRLSPTFAEPIAQP